MSKQIVVLFGLNAEHKIIESDLGIAFATGKLMHEQWVAMYVAKSKPDAEAAIQHYSDQGTLTNFLKEKSHSHEEPTHTPAERENGRRYY